MSRDSGAGTYTVPFRDLACYFDFSESQQLCYYLGYKCGTNDNCRDFVYGDDSIFVEFFAEFTYDVSLRGFYSIGVRARHRYHI